MSEHAIERILVPLDGSDYGERALPWAIAIAGDSADLVLVEVVPPAAAVVGFTGQTIATASEIREGYQAAASENLRQVQERWLAGRPNVRVLVEEGHPAEVIVAVAEREGADLVAMSSHGRGAVGRFVSGSVADRVVRNATVPVMIVGPAGDAPRHPEPKRVLVPIDGTHGGATSLPVAASLAALTGLPVVVLSVVGVATESLPTTMGGMEMVPPAFYEEVQKAHQRDATTAVDAAVSELAAAGIAVSGEVLSGDVNGTLLAAIEPGDIIVLASRGQSGLPRWVMGSTAMKLIQSAEVPVVVVGQPAGA